MRMNSLIVSFLAFSRTAAHRPRPRPHHKPKTHTTETRKKTLIHTKTALHSSRGEIQNESGNTTNRDNAKHGESKKSESQQDTDTRTERGTTTATSSTGSPFRANSPQSRLLSTSVRGRAQTLTLHPCAKPCLPAPRGAPTPTHSSATTPRTIPTRDRHHATPFSRTPLAA